MAKVDFPDRVTLVKYETIATKPFRTVKKISSLVDLGSGLPERTLNWVVDNMKSEDEDDWDYLNVFSTKRKISEMHVRKWQPRWRLRQWVNCSDVLSHMNYI